MKRKVFFTAIFILVLFSSGEAFSASTSLTLEPGPYTIRENPDGSQRIVMHGFRTMGAPGNPLLPAKVYNILVPPDVLWESVRMEVLDCTEETVPGSYNLGPAAPDAAQKEGGLTLDWGPEAKSIVQGMNVKVYQADALFPAEFVQQLPYSRLRKWNFVRVRFLPFRYNPVTGELRLVKKASVKITFLRSLRTADVEASLADTVMDPVAPALFHNYESSRTDYRAPTGSDLPGAVHDYVIITGNATVSGSANLSAFIAHKEARGHSVLVVTETDFDPLTGQAPNHRAEKIRQWLMNNYLTYAIENVLLIGNPRPYGAIGGEGDIPMKMCWPRLGETDDEEAPTDAFYADLTGNWDLDGDEYFGEWSDYAGSGGVDFSMEVWVGRIPVYSEDYATLDNILQKIMDYETESDSPGSIGWRRKVLLPMSFSNTTYDGAPLAEQMRDDFLATRSVDSWRQYQQGTGACSLNSVYNSEETLRGGTVVRDRWASEPFGIVCWWGHGSATSASVGCDGCWDGTLFNYTQTSSLDDDYPAFTYQCSCTNGYAENANNLQYSILKQGGVGTVSATRVSWFNTGVGYGEFNGSSTNSGIGYEFVDRLTQALPAGRALLEAKLAVVTDIGTRKTRLMNQYDFNLYGDPSLDMGPCVLDEHCDDGQWCNGEETCAAGLCQAGTPVTCDDADDCTEDTCDEVLDTCVFTCDAAGVEDPCCEEAVCEGDPVCSGECIDSDGDGYGDPASVSCTYPDLDCDDTNPDVNPGMTEIPGNGLDDDCKPGTPAWGTPASLIAGAHEQHSRAGNYLLMLLLPLAMVLVWRGMRKRG